MEGRYVDWWKALNSNEWVCIGQQIMEGKKGYWSEDNPEGITGDDYLPMYNFAYPLGLSSLDDETIIKVCQETSCTVVYNTDEDALYLALCGCGMDMSQDIALAYMIAYAYNNEGYGRLPDHMLFDVYRSGALSVSREAFGIIKQKLVEGFQGLKQRCEYEMTQLAAKD